MRRGASVARRSYARQGRCDQEDRVAANFGRYRGRRRRSRGSGHRDESVVCCRLASVVVRIVLDGVNRVAASPFRGVVSLVDPFHLRRSARGEGRGDR